MIAVLFAISLADVTEQQPMGPTCDSDYFCRNLNEGYHWCIQRGDSKSCVKHDLSWGCLSPNYAFVCSTFGGRAAADTPAWDSSIATCTEDERTGMPVAITCVCGWQECNDVSCQTVTQHDSYCPLSRVCNPGCTTSTTTTTTTTTSTTTTIMITTTTTTTTTTTVAPTPPPPPCPACQECPFLPSGTLLLNKIDAPLAEEFQYFSHTVQSHEYLLHVKPGLKDPGLKLQHGTHFIIKTQPLNPNTNIMNVEIVFEGGDDDSYSDTLTISDSNPFNDTFTSEEVDETIQLKYCREGCIGATTPPPPPPGVPVIPCTPTNQSEIVAPSDPRRTKEEIAWDRTATVLLSVGLVIVMASIVLSVRRHSGDSPPSYAPVSPNTFIKGSY